MKKFIITFIVLILVLTIPFSFVACGEDNVDALKQTIEDLKSQIEELKKQLTSSNADLQDKIQQLETRVEKLETSYALISTLEERISALEDGGMDTSQYEELKTNVENLQKALTDNNASDNEIKSQVTGMQLVLDKIYGEEGTDGVLTEIQNSLNTLYGEVNRVVQFENGKEYEVKLNGVVYYTVSVLVEYHDGKVQSDQDIVKCSLTNKHWCGSITITNKSFTTITTTNLTGLAKYIFDNSYVGPINALSQNGSVLPEEETSVSHNYTKKWYFEINPAGKSVENNLKIWFTVPQNYTTRLLILDNVWDGIQAPIQGEK